MCGCGGGSRSSINRTTRAVSPRVINQASINRKVNSVEVTPKSSIEDKKRIAKLHKDAIRKTFGK